MPNWVIICHGRPDTDRGTVHVPDNVQELTFWVNEGQPALVSQAELIITELQRNPAELASLQALIDKIWGPKVDWLAVQGAAGQPVQGLYLWGDPGIDCVGVLNLDTRQFVRWSDATEVPMVNKLKSYPGSIHLICCR